MMTLINNRKGSHVGLVLSFVVFVTFVFFIFSVLNPAVKQRQGKELNLDLLKENLINSLSSNLSVTSLKINDAYNYQKDCFIINDSASIGGEYTKVKDVEDNLINGSTISGTNLIFIHPDSKKFFRIFHSIGFEPFVPPSSRGGYDPGCESLDSENFTLGITRVNKYLFTSKIDEMFYKYENNYSELKEELGVSEYNDFGIAFVNETDEIQKGFQNVSSNVYIDQIPIQYYDTEAKIGSGSIKIRVW